MSGQPCKTPSDAQKYRDAYMANLNLQIKNDDKNFQANKLHQRTGVVATQISDYRSTSEKLADVEMLRALVKKELLQICDSINCQAIVQKLSADELQFVAQNIETIVKDLRPKNKFGVLEPIFRSYIATQMNSAMKAEANAVGIMLENRGVSSLAMLKQLETQVISSADIIDGLGKIKVLGRNDMVRVLNGFAEIVIAKLNILTPQFYKRIEDIPDHKERLQALETVAMAIRELPSKEQFREQINAIMEAPRGDEKNERIAELAELLDVPSLQFLVKTEQEVPGLKAGNLSDPRELLKDLKYKKDILKIIEPYIALTSYEELFGMRKTAFNQLTLIELKDEVRSKMETLIAMYEGEMASVREMGEKGGDALGYEFGNNEVFTRSTAPKSRNAGDIGHMGGESGLIRRMTIQRRIEREPKEQESLAKLNELQEKRKKEKVTKIVRQHVGKRTPEIREREEAKQAVRERSKNVQAELLRLAQEKEERLQEIPKKARRRRPIQFQAEPVEIPRGTQGGEPSKRISRVGHGLPFGNYFLHPHKLKDDIVCVQTQKGRNHPQLPTKRVSKGLGTMLRHIASGGNPSYSDLHKMTEADRSHLSDLIRICKVDVDVPEGNDKEDLDQFEILQGELIAGNDSPELVKKLKLVILKLMNKGRLPKGQARDILTDLVALGY